MILKPNEIDFRVGMCCHVCGNPVDIDDVAVVHDGHVKAREQDEEYGSILLHTWCATVLAMRLIHDAMGNTRSVQTPQRAVERLRRG